MHEFSPWRRNPVARWLAALVSAALLVGGGVVLGAHLASGTSPAPLSMKLTSSYQHHGHAAALSSVLGHTGSATSLSDIAMSGGAGKNWRRDLAGLRSCLRTARKLARSGHFAAARAKLLSCLSEYHARWLLLVRRLLLLGGVHGQITFMTKKGSRTVVFERGVIQTVSKNSTQVKAADGTVMTWTLISKTLIVRAKHLASTAALAVGQRVFVVGAVVGGADNARLIIIRG